jgi:photosystem II stability/assembly factor-like uncharacterized protein
MKHTTLLSFIILTSSLQLCAQQKYYYNFDAECGRWSFDNNLPISRDPISDVFTWQFATVPYIDNITDIFFIDSSKGWLSHTSTGIAKTTDGGFTWDTVSFHDSTFTTSYNGVYFINQNTGWAVGGAVQIRKTINGGLTWFKQYSVPVAGVLNSIYFFDTDTGFAIGRKTASYNSFIERTTNGGASWTEITATTSANNELSCQFWFNSNTGWICGRDVLLKTTNGGLNWTNYYANIPPTQNGANALLGIYFVNQQTGWIGASNLDHKNIYKTTNGGSNWVFQDNPVAQYTYVQINDVKFLSSDSGWAVHGTPFSGAIMFTTNGGTNWIIEEGSNYWFDCLTYYQRYKAWCGSSAGRVWYTYFQNNPVGVSGNNNFPFSYALYQNFPNPFNPVTTIKFRIAKEGRVKLSVFDVTGREIQNLLKAEFSPGEYSYQFNASNYSSGVYFYRLVADGFVETKKMVIIK